MNLSAPFIPQFFKSQVDEILPYVDVLIGNESEAEAFAASHEWDVRALLSLLPLVSSLLHSTHALCPSPATQTKDIATIAQKLAALPKKNEATPRLVVITQGASSTIAASTSSSLVPSGLKVFPVSPLAADKIVDTNGAGDAFAGGFLGARALGKGVDEAVEAGHKMGQMNVQLSGPTFKFPKVQIL